MGTAARSIACNSKNGLIHQFCDSFLRGTLGISLKSMIISIFICQYVTIYRVFIEFAITHFNFIQIKMKAISICFHFSSKE